MFGNKLKILAMLVLNLILSQALKVHASEEPMHLHFVTFIDPPYIFDHKARHKKGLTELLVDKLMNNIKVNYDINVLPAKRAEIAARSNEHTCIFPIERSQEREVFFSWVSPIVVSHHGFFSLASNTTNEAIHLSTLKDAYPYRIGSYLGSSIGDYLASFNYQVDYAAQNAANIKKLKYGRIDLWASDILSAQYISEDTGIEITQSKLDFFTTLRAIGCHPSVPEELITSMKKELQSMFKNGQIYNIKQKFKATLFSKPNITSR